MNRRDFVKALIASATAGPQVIAKGLAEAGAATIDVPPITKSPDEGQRKNTPDSEAMLSISNKKVGNIISLQEWREPGTLFEVPCDFAGEAEPTEITLAIVTDNTTSRIDVLKRLRDKKTKGQRCTFAISLPGTAKMSGISVITHLAASDSVSPDGKDEIEITIKLIGMISYKHSL